MLRCLAVLLLQLLCVTGLLICCIQKRAELVPASSTRRSDGSSALAPVFFRLRLAKPQGSVRDASLHCPLSGRGVCRCRQYEPDIEGQKKPEVTQDKLGMEVGGRAGNDVQWDWTKKKKKSSGKGICVKWEV